MDYGKLFSRSFEIAWQHKWLWVFGMFAGGMGSINFDFFPTFDQSFFEPHRFDQAAETTLMLIPAFLLMAVAYLLAYCVSTGGIIDGVNRITRTDEHGLGVSFSVGVDMIWRILGLGIIYFVIQLGIMGAIVGGLMLLAIPLGLASSGGLNDSGATAGLVILFLILVIPFVAAWTCVWTSNMALAQRSLVIRNNSIADAMVEGWKLFRQNLGKSILVWLVIAFLAFFVTIAGFICFFAINSFTHAIFGEDLGMINRLVIGLIAGSPFTFLFGGLMGAFACNIYTLFYFELVEPGSVLDDKEVIPPIAGGEVL